MNSIIKCLLCGLFMLLFACSEEVYNAKKLDIIPNIYPDYTGITVPFNIAPLNFSVLNCNYNRMEVSIKNSKNKELRIDGETINIPLKEWKDLLSDSKNDSLIVTVFVKEGNTWSEYKPFKFYISEHPIDYGLVYRKIAPGYEVYSKMGIYERSLESFEETPIIENTLVRGMCVNCHAFNQNNPNDISLHIRGNNGATLIKTESGSKLLTTKTEQTLASAVYPYWHPSGKYVAYSTNQTRQGFHVGQNKRVEVIDLASDIMVYDVEKDELITCDLLKGESSFETYPVFSPDGSKLYFCSANAKQVPEQFEDIHYNLCSIDFDAANGIFGSDIDTLINAEKNQKSITFPRPSYDGKYIMYTLSDYGNFSIWHKEADLWLLNLLTGETKELKAANSSDTESFHNWSSNNKWYVFSSRRENGLFTQLFIASIAENGESGKPFLLPQKDPGKECLEDMYSYNVPEFTIKPINLDARMLEKQLTSTKRVQVKMK